MGQIARGDRGNEVADVQRRLATLGYDIGPAGADGSFGSATEAALKLFQQEHALESTGRVSEETWHRLVEECYELGDRLLYLRTPFFRGSDVKRLQLWLNKLGFNTGIVDGIFGQTTERAAREFQRNIGLSADGIVGDSTNASFKTLKAILEDHTSPVFPDPERASAISAIVGRLVAVDNGAGLEAEFAGRVGNLLELLGAQVFKADSDEAAQAEVSVEFEIESIDAASIVYYEAEPAYSDPSRHLATTIVQELESLLGCTEGRVEARALDKGMPAVLIRPPLALSPDDAIGQEVYRQKVAVAVFDAVKAFLESAV